MNSRPHGAPRRALLVLALPLVAAACHEGGGRERLPGVDGVAAFERHGQWLSVFGGTGAGLGRIVHMEIMNGFMPGQVPELTGIALGHPDTIKTGRGGARYFVYRRSEGVFEVGEEPYAEGVSYPLYFYPADRRPERLLHAAVVRHLRPNLAKEVVQVFECGVQQPGVVVVLKGGLVEHLIWLPITEVALRANSRHCTPWDES